MKALFKALLAGTAAVVLAGCATTGGGSAPAQPKGQLVPLANAGFTPDAQGRLLPWSMNEHASGNSYTFIADTAQSVSPPSSLRIRRHGTEVFGLADQRLRVKPEWIGKTMRLSGWLRSEGANGTGGALIFTARDGSDYVIRHNHMDERRVTGDQPWARHSVELKLPPATWWIQVAVMLEGGGTLWADDLELEILD